MANGKFYAALSTSALMALLAVVNPYSASAANRDVYDNATKQVVLPSTATFTQKVDFVFDNLGSEANFGFELNGKVYNFGAVNAAVGALSPEDRNSAEKVLAAVETVASVPVDEYTDVEENLAVSSVSAITTTHAEVTFPALATAKQGATVLVKDGSGAVVEVVAQDLAAGATGAQFDFVTPVAAAKLAGVWSVNGVNFSFTELELVQDIVAEASAGPVNEVKLLALLNQAGIKNINNTYLGDYATEIAAELPVWFADVQKNIDDVNKDNADTASEAAIVKTVVDASSQVQLLAALQANFERVNADWIVGYAGETVGGVTGMLALDGVATPAHYNVTKAQIQTAIDTENAAQIAALDAAADTSAKQASVTTLIQTWVENDDPTTPLVTPKADAIEASNIKRLAFVVAESTTENSLYNALVAYANATPDATLKASELNANIKAFYLSALTTKTKATLVGEIQAGTENIKGDIVTAADALALEDAVVELGAAATTLAGTDNATNRAAFTAKLEKLANFTSHQTAANAKFLMSTINSSRLVAYATQMDSDGIATGDAVVDVQGSVTTVNDAAALDVAVAVIGNASSTAAQVKEALTTLALSSSNTTTDAYVNASSQIKSEVAQLVVANKASLGSPLTVAKVITHNGGGAPTYAANALQKAMADHAAKLVEFNTIGDLSGTDIATTKGALDTYAYAPYVALSASEKLAVAEEINKLTKMAGSPAVATPLDFSGADAVTTLAQANAIIDAAIAAIK